MGNLSEQYRKRMEVEGRAPSGQVFRWRLPNSAQYAAATGTVPGVFNVTLDPRNPDALTDETVQKNNALNRALALQCVIYPKLVDDSKKDFTEPDGEWLPISEVSQADINWIGARIAAGVGTRIEEIETARRAL